MNQILTVPKLNPNDPTVELVLWYFKAGEKIEVGDALCDFATSKAAFTFDSTAAGFLKPRANVSARLQVGDVFAEICSTYEEAVKLQPEIKLSPSAMSQTTFSKKAKEKILELDLDESVFAGYPYVTEKMVLARVPTEKSGAVSLLKEKEIEALMAGSSALRSSLTIQISAKKLIDDIRKSSTSGSISISAYMAWASAQTLQTYPQMMDYFGQSRPSDEVEIGFAMDTGTGTRSMCASNCSTWSPEKWREQITDWGLRLMRNKVELKEMGSGRVTITDLISEGLSSFEPLLVGKQSCILGFAADLEREDRQISVTLAFDHRLHNGREAAQFLKALKNRILSMGS